MFSIGLIYVECSRHEIGIKKFFDNVQKPFDITVNPSDSGQCHRLDFFRFGARTNIFECKLIKFIVNTGSLLDKMRWVQLHPSILGNGCMHPSIFRAATSILIFCLLFPVNVQILQPSIEISNKGTVMGTHLLNI